MSISRELARLRPNSSGQLPTANIQDAAITTAKIADAAVVEADIANLAVTNAKIASLAASKLTGQLPDANAPSGSVIQVVQSFQTTTFSIGSGVSSYVTVQTGVITPSSTSSRILIICREHASGDIDNDSQAISYLQTRILRNGTQIKESAANCDVRGGNQRILDAGWKWLDSPNTTSAVTYETQWRNTIANSAGRNSYMNMDQMGTMILMEIAG